MMFKEKALVFGGTGQDGTIISNLLQKKGLKVIILGRNFRFKKHLVADGVEYRKFDILQDDTDELLMEVKPNLIIYAAAFHGSAGYQYEEKINESFIVNTRIPIQILEFCKNHQSTKFVYFGSSKVFDLHEHLEINEEVLRRPTCVYSLEKELAYNGIVHYRNQYGVNAYNFWLFNHESELREKTYFIPILINAVKNSMIDPNSKTNIMSLDFFCDWGCAHDYMSAITSIVGEHSADDIVIASGQTVSGRELASVLFKEFGLDYRDHIVVKDNHELDMNKRWQVNTTKLKSKYDKPFIGIIDLCKSLVMRDEQRQ